MKFHEEGILKKMEGERRFAFIPVALPHFVSLPLPPSVSLSPLVLLPLSPVLSGVIRSFLAYHISAPCGPSGHRI